MNYTGTGNTTFRFGAEPCWKCGGRDYVTAEDFGYFWTSCMSCGNEGPPKY